MGAHFGVVKEDIADDSTILPCFNGRVVSWLVSADGSNQSDNCLEVPNSERDSRACNTQQPNKDLTTTTCVVPNQMIPPLTSERIGFI